jgi:hypothetical protein
MTTLLEELTTGPLAAELAPLIAVADEVGILAVLYRVDIVIPGNIKAHDIKLYLSLNSLRLPVLDSILPACREFNQALEDFNEGGFDLFIPAILNKITQVLNAIIADGSIVGFTESIKQALLSLGNQTISRAEQVGLYIIDIDIRMELWNDDGTRKLQ